jgi:hypothetical protein
MEAVVENALKDLYANYSNNIKPLIAVIEANTQKLPIEIFNEIRAVNDHIARCIMSGEEKFCVAEIQKAHSHQMRILLDCFKHLNIFYFDRFEQFEKQDMKYVNLSLVNNGEFYTTLRAMQNEAHRLSAEARIAESLDKNKALELYDQMYNKCNAIEEYINDNIKNIDWAKKIYRRRNALTIIVSSITSLLIGYLASKVDIFITAIKHLFG